MVQDKGILVHATPANELTEKLFGVEGILCKEFSDDSGGSNNAVDSTKVPSGKIWVITHICAWNEDGNIDTGIEFQVRFNWYYRKIRRTVAEVAQRESVDLHTLILLEEDDIIRVNFYGVSVGETNHFVLHGYIMNAP